MLEMEGEIKTAFGNIPGSDQAISASRFEDSHYRIALGKSYRTTSPTTSELTGKTYAAMPEYGFVLRVSIKEAEIRKLLVLVPEN